MKMFTVLYAVVNAIALCPFLTSVVSQPWGPYAHLVGFQPFLPELLLQEVLWGRNGRRRPAS